MLYSIKQMAQMSGVSTRTLRYYDEIHLLEPAKINEAGYRFYSTVEVDRLQQILFYRELNFKLSDIQKILASENQSIQSILHTHYDALVEKRHHIDSLIKAVEHTIAYHKGEIEMSNEEKFAAFKKKRVEENESMFGEEIREKYGTETVDEANKSWMQMSEESYKEMQEVERELIERLKQFNQQTDQQVEDAKQIVMLHKEWLQYSWSTYSSEAHKGLAEMYIADERFTQYYDEKAGVGAARLLRDSILAYA
ncbi:MerR family transcriptional regulator [Cytobacillus sp. Sa5YUA1]|uniref:MerR family transcriptional regulator n=1 Tax=Cytobacillus stercorigallinarum TaxID=2762240 RepID=A0ABR8QR00_9BACI|nr:MerR family transcriptional regulator [Cytobacillus stercorigallinarum]MBD7937702.1 MerR family transcriptional regulator [Cytobacillus stercorigallinarum]